MLLSFKAGKAPKRTHFQLREYGRIRPYSCILLFKKDSRSSFRARLKRGIWANLARLLRVLFRCAARAFAFLRRRAALALSASRGSCAGFRLLQARLLRSSLRTVFAFCFCWRGRGSCVLLRARWFSALVKVRAREGANTRRKSPTTGQQGAAPDRLQPALCFARSSLRVASASGGG